jgi:hypothetical protein
VEIDDVLLLDGVANTMDSITFTQMYVGDYDNVAGDVHIDNVIIANDETIDLFTYSPDTDYDTCN